MIVGLGTGRTASRAIQALAERVKDEKLDIQCVPTSHATETLAKFHGLKLVDFALLEKVDYLFDGADEVDPQLRMLKGAGGAMTRERIVAAAADRRVYIVDESKLVDRLGQRSTLAVAVIAFGLNGVVRRTLDGHLCLTDNGSLVVDVTLEDRDVAELACAINDIPGVVDHGLFLNEADEVLVETARGIERMRRPE
jgi:ribose 5-phosphate isomerase A